MANVKFPVSPFNQRKPNSVFKAMIQISFGKFIARIRGYVKENWGSPFIVGFMLLLFSAAVSLVTGLSSLADTIAVYAYYALVAGVFLQLACFVKYRRKNNDAEVAV